MPIGQDPQLDRLNIHLYSGEDENLKATEVSCIHGLIHRVKDVQRSWAIVDRSGGFSQEEVEIEVELPLKRLFPFPSKKSGETFNFWSQPTSHLPTSSHPVEPSVICIALHRLATYTPSTASFPDRTPPYPAGYVAYNGAGTHDLTST